MLRHRLRMHFTPLRVFFVSLFTIGLTVMSCGLMEGAPLLAVGLVCYVFSLEE